MCGLFGFVRYGKNIKNLPLLTNALAEQAALRGTDATGIAFCEGGKLRIHKDGKSAYELDFKHSDEVRTLIGHTRHSTQGSEKKNFNNHPFPGKVSGLDFALAHNGVLMNDDELRKSLNLPKTKIETDSYVAVQLIMSKKKLDFESIKFMAEKVSGSFSFSIVDGEENLYLVKGESPLHILHFPKSEIYVFASTEAILFKALVDTFLFTELKRGEYEEVSICEGDIFKINASGVLTKSRFDYKYYCGKGWWEYGEMYFPKIEHEVYTEQDYIDELKYIAMYQGIDPEEIDELLAGGFTLDELEDYVYGA